MDDYYSPHPRFHLDRAIAIAGQIGSGARMVGRCLAARTGLPFVDVDRQVEHDCGASLAEIASRIGPQRLSQRARDVLERTALQRPWPVIVLDAAWPCPKATHLFARRFALVHVQRPTSFLLERIEKDVRRAGDWLIGERPFVFRDFRDLESLHGERAEILASAQILYDAENQHPHRVAEGLQEALCGMGGMEAT